MDAIKFYASIFMRRLPYFLVITMIVSAVSVVIAMKLPPAYVSNMRLIVEAPQIPNALAASTVTTTAQEQLQIMEQRLLTRPVLLDIASKLDVFPEQDKMSPDQIVDAMRARTSINSSGGRNQATLMSMTFEAISPQIAAGVLNEYLTKIQQEDVEYRRQRAVKTLEFFEREVERLSAELDDRSARILKFKEDNSDALPSNLQFRQAQQGALQTNLEQTDRQIFSLRSQREKLIEVYTSTGQIVGINQQNLTPEEQQLQQLRAQLNEDLVVYSESNPKIKLLKARIENLETTVAAQQAANPSSAGGQTGNPALDLQLAQLDSQIEALQEQKIILEEKLAEVSDSIARTPANSITQADLQRDYDNIQGQYNLAVERLARASTGERIEETSQGQRISVIEHPAVPTRPSKPNRRFIAAGGSFFGVGLGIAFIVLLELLNRTVRRPEDLVKKLEVWPIATIPYVQTKAELLMWRTRRAAIILVIILGVPAGVITVHEYYQPLDLIADRMMDKLGVRW